jgi:hypothetical protein
LVESAFAKTPLPEQDVPLWIPTLYYGVGQVTPIIPYTAWGHLSRAAMFDGVHNGIHEKLHLVCHCRPPPESSEFEGLVFEVMGMFMFWFANCERSVLVSRCIVLAQWLPLNRFDLVNIMKLGNERLPLNPHDTSGNADDVRKNGSLSEEFNRTVSALTVGQGIWFHCGGSAAIDFILVVRTTVNSYCLRFLDAKHVTLMKRTSRVPNSAELEHAAISRKLLVHFQSLERTTTTVESFSASHVLVLTNNPSIQPNTLSPETFKWDPWTGILFHCSALIEQDQAAHDGENPVDAQ